MEKWLTVAITLLLTAVAAYIGIYIYRFLALPGYAVSVDKYSIFVDLLVVMLAVSAAAGGVIYTVISSTVRQQVISEARREKNRGRAHMMTTLGYVWFRHHEAHSSDEGQRARVDYLAWAIEAGKYAVASLGELDKERDEELTCSCKSNLAYYLAEKQRLTKDLGAEEKEQVRKLALDIYRVARSERAREYRDAYHWEDTYAWVLWRLGEDDQAALKKARSVIKGLLERPSVPKEWREELRNRYSELLNA